MQFHNQDERLWYFTPDPNRELTNDTTSMAQSSRPASYSSPDDESSLDDESGPADDSTPVVARAHRTRRKVWKRSAALATRLVVSNDAQHSAKQVCRSDGSHGPDFVAVKEGLFCDMGTKTLWPICGEATTYCFDREQKKLLAGTFEARDEPSQASIGYATVTQWK